MNATGQESIRRVFTEGFSDRDIAEPLVSFDDSMIASVALATMIAGHSTFPTRACRKHGTFSRNAGGVISRLPCSTAFKSRTWGESWHGMKKSGG